MSKNPKFYIVEASALPEIFLKVAQARELIQTGEAQDRQRGDPYCGDQPQRILQVPGYGAAL